MVASYLKKAVVLHTSGVPVPKASLLKLLITKSLARSRSSLRRWPLASGWVGLEGYTGPLERLKAWSGIDTYIYLYIYVCIYIYVDICIYVCMYLYIYLCICICTCIYVEDIEIWYVHHCMCLFILVYTHYYIYIYM